MVCSFRKNAIVIFYNDRLILSYITIKNEYPDLGGNYTVYHSSEYIDQLLRRDLITPQQANAQRTAFHDPCYLSRTTSATKRLAPRSRLFPSSN